MVCNRCRSPLDCRCRCRTREQVVQSSCRLADGRRIVRLFGIYRRAVDCIAASSVADDGRNSVVVLVFRHSVGIIDLSPMALPLVALLCNRHIVGLRHGQSAQTRDTRPIVDAGVAEFLVCSACYGLYFLILRTRLRLYTCFGRLGSADGLLFFDD